MCPVLHLWVGKKKAEGGGGRRRAGYNVVSGKTLHTNVFIFGETFKNPA